MGSTVQSDTEIMNMALDLLVEDPINDVSDNRSVARFMRRNYDTIRDALLRRAPWNFAIERTSLPKLDSAPAYEWDYQYALPSDCLRLLPLTSDGTMHGHPVDYVVEGGKVLTDKLSPIKVRYIKRITDTSLYDPNFTNALAHVLAIRAAPYMTGKTSLVKELSHHVVNAISEAQLLDSLEGTPQPIQDHDIILAR